MTRYEFKKFPLPAIILTMIALFLAVVCISSSLIADHYDGFAPLAIFEIAASVLVLAGLTTGRIGLTRVISLIITICLVISSFILTIVKYSSYDVALFCLSLLMFICSILVLVYFLSIKNERIQKMHFVSTIFFSSFLTLYTIIYVITDLMENLGTEYPIHYEAYFLLLSYICVSLLPLFIHRSLNKIVPNETNNLD